jgi:hypothetical protein
MTIKKSVKKLDGHNVAGVPPIKTAESAKKR